MQNALLTCYILGTSLIGAKRTDLMLRIIASVLIAVWLLLVILGKGGFVHLLLLNGIVIWVIDAVSIYRSRMTES
jgi:hypothetical protein